MHFILNAFNIGKITKNRRLKPRLPQAQGVLLEADKAQEENYHNQAKFVSINSL